MADALTTATSVLTAGWSFIQSNPILMGVCSVGLISSAVFAVKSFF